METQSVVGIAWPSDVRRRIETLVRGWRALRQAASAEQFQPLRPTYEAFVIFKEQMLGSAWQRLLESGQLETAEREFLKARGRLPEKTQNRVPVLLAEAPGPLDRLVNASETGLNSAVLWVAFGAGVLLWLRRDGKW